LSKKTLVLGASLKPERVSNQAIKKLVKHKHEVLAVGRNSGFVDGIEILTNAKIFDDIDTVTIYLSEKNQEGLFKYFKELKPKRVIFNPGAENPILCSQLQRHEIECLEACTLVMLSVGSY